MPTAHIATKQAKYTLEQLHAELAGKILDNKKEADRLRQAMLHVEAVLKLLDPAHNLRPIAIRRRKPNRWFKRGTVFRLALDVLRGATEPLTARQITLRMLADRGVTDAEPKAIRDLIGAINSSLQNKRGRAVTVVGEGSPAHWTIRRAE